MKSKTSFFNSAIFRKNAALYWPVWACYTLYLLAVCPGAMWLKLYNLVRSGSDPAQSAYVEVLGEVLSVFGAVISIGIMAIITGMALYNYLCVPRSAQAIHALPVTRAELFGTNLASGLSFLMIPQLLAFFASLFICLSYEVTCVEYLGLYLLVEFGLDLLLFSMVTFCAMLSGQMVAIPVFFFIGNFLYLAIYYVVSVVVPYLAYGVYVYDEGKGTWLSPVYYLCANVWFCKVYETTDGKEALTGLSLENGSALLWYLLFAAALFAASYLFYRKRQLENTGDLITVGFVRPIFRWGVAFMSAYLSAILLKMALDNLYFELPDALLVGFGLFAGVLFFFLAQMLLEKNFRVFRKKFLSETVFCALFLLASFGGMWGIARYEENYIPDADEIKSATIEMNLMLPFSQDEMEELLEIHRTILSCKEENRSVDDWDDEACGIEIDYYLKNGRSVRRYYVVRWDGAMEETVSYLHELEEDPDTFLDVMFGLYDGVRPVIEYMEIYGYNMDDAINEFYFVYDAGLEETAADDADSEKKRTAQAIYDAILADVQAGTLQKYNLYSYSEAPEVWEHTYTMCIDIDLYCYLLNNGRAENSYTDVGAVLWDNYYYTSIEFGDDCENTINALKDCGIIGSEEDLYLLSEYETLEVE